MKKRLRKKLGEAEYFTGSQPITFVFKLGAGKEIRNKGTIIGAPKKGLEKFLNKYLHEKPTTAAFNSGASGIAGF